MDDLRVKEMEDRVIEEFTKRVETDGLESAARQLLRMARDFVKEAGVDVIAINLGNEAGERMNETLLCYIIDSQLGGSLRITKADLDEWMKDHPAGTLTDLTPDDQEVVVIGAVIGKPGEDRDEAVARARANYRMSHQVH